MDCTQFIPDVDVAALLARLNLSDPHCNEGALDYETLSGSTPPVLSGSDLNSSSRSSVGSISPVSELNDMFLVDCFLPFAEAAEVVSKPPAADEQLGGPQPQLFAAEAPQRDPSRYKTELCREWQTTETCRFGDRCEFAHGEKELRTSSENEAVATSLARLVTRFSKVAAPSAACRSAKGRPAFTAPQLATATPLVVAVGRPPLVLPVVMGPPPARLPAKPLHVPAPPSSSSSSATAPPPLGPIDTTHLSITVGAPPLLRAVASPLNLQDTTLFCHSPQPMPAVSFTAHAIPIQTAPPAAWGPSPPWMKAPPSSFNAPSSQLPSQSSLAISIPIPFLPCGLQR